MKRTALLGIAAVAVLIAPACGDDDNKGTGGSSSTTSSSSSSGTGGSGGDGGATQGSPTGSACADNAQCESEACLTEDPWGWPGGYCSGGACNGVVTCPDGEICVDMGAGYFCLGSCSADADCRDGYTCYDFGDGTSVCAPLCTSDAQCTAPDRCNVETGYCQPPEVCNDGTDNDGDGLTDCADDECAADAMCQGALDTACMGAKAAQASNTGNTEMGTALFSGSCSAQGGAKEDVYTYTAPDDGLLRLTLESAADQGIYVRTTCADGQSEVACEDTQYGGSQEKLELLVTKDEKLFIFVDGFTPQDIGPYTLSVDFAKAVCGDNTLTPPEECDDGNLVAGDGCNEACKFESIKETEPNDSSMAATTVMAGKIIGLIDTPGDNDWYKITVPGPVSRISVRTEGDMGEGCAPNNGAVDTEVEILALDGTTSMAKNDDIDAFENYCSEAVVVGYAGDYFIRVGSSPYCQDCTFPYALFIEVE